MFKLVVFDLDGTLANTLMDLANAINSALNHFKLPTYELEKYNKFVGNGIDNLITQVLGDKADDKVLHSDIRRYFDEYYPQHICDFTVPYDGMQQLLSKLAQSGVMTAVHSNKPHVYVPTILKKLYPDHEFKFVSGQQSCFERKPSPQALLYMMHELSVDPKDVLYVGDSDVDVITAHNAGVMVCGVSWGFRGAEELRSVGADFIVDNTDELYNIIIGIYE